jgi:hypothetical protein
MVVKRNLDFLDPDEFVEIVLKKYSLVLLLDLPLIDGI